jgi:photosystem II stability/assembly factor-like uncharacterized protein
MNNHNHTHNHAALLFALALGGCLYHAPFVVVTVDGDALGEMQLRVSAALHPSWQSLLVPAAPAPLTLPSTFTLELPAGARGPLALHVDALDSTGARFAAGDASVVLAGDGQYRARVTLSPIVWSQTILDPAIDLTAVWGPATGDVWVVGQKSTILRSSDHGATWNAERFAGPLTDFNNVWGSASDDLWAVGWNGLVARSTGDGQWAPVASGAGASTLLLSVWGASKSDVFVVGKDSTLLHFDGTLWHPLLAPVAGDFFCVLGFPAEKLVLVVGGRADHQGAVVLRSTDGGQSFAALMPPSGELHNLWGASPRDLFAIGADATVLRSTDGGTSWAVTASTPGGSTLWTNWGRDATELYAVGSSGEVLHSADDGASWPRERVPSTQNLGSVWGRASELYIVGNAGTILERQ